MSGVCIREFTDPGCPWAWSAEPSRRRLDWLYGEHLQWSVCMVGLAADPEEYAAKGVSTASMAESSARIAREHRMPIDSREKPRLAATVPACRAVVAARLNAPEAERPLLRRLRVLHHSGALLDEPETVATAAREAGLDPGELERWMEEEEVEERLRADMADARQPMPAARVLDDKLANWSGGRRYTCPSYEIVRQEDGVRIAVPGFQPFAVYDTILANLVPGLERRDPPADVSEILRAANVPLASQEVAVVLDIPFDAAREELGRVADECHVGADGFWTLRDAG